MKKIKIVFTCLTLLFFSAMLVNRYTAPAENASPQKNSGTSYPEIAQTVQATEPSEANVTSKAEPNSYEIKEYRGNIAVFEVGSDKPFRTTDIAVKSLPIADQGDLMRGIEVHSQEELQCLLEDYLS